MSTSRNCIASGRGRKAWTPTGIPGRSLKEAAPDLARRTETWPRPLIPPRGNVALGSSRPIAGSWKEPFWLKPVIALNCATSGRRTLRLVMASLWKAVMTMRSRATRSFAGLAKSGFVGPGKSLRLPFAGRSGLFCE